MKTPRIWHGVRMRQTLVGTDPDQPPLGVTLPMAWDDHAAAGLLALVRQTDPPPRRVHLLTAAAAWIDPVAAAVRRSGGDPTIVDRLHRLLLLRRAAPSEAVWSGQPHEDPGFVLNLPAFLDTYGHFDAAGFAEAVETAVAALRLLAPAARSLGVGMADLHGLLAALGIGYGTPAARDIAAALAALLRGRADAAAQRATTGGAMAMAWPEPPEETAIPGLVQAARAARAAAGRAPAGRIVRTTAIRIPGPVEALLGVETGGIAPAFSPLNASGGLSRASLAWLAVSGMTAEEALANVLAGGDPLPVADAVAHAAMHDAVAPFFDTMPPRPAVLEAAPRRARRRELPDRHAGYTQRASVGGHRIFLRTGEYDDGSLGEIAIALARESPAFRGLMDGFATAVSIGLQHGVPLQAYVDAFLLSRFSPAGAVEGDPAVRHATSLIDYIVRHLAANYLGRRDLPEADPDAGDLVEAPPLLPMELPAGGSPRARRRSFRVVSRQPG